MHTAVMSKIYQTPVSCWTRGGGDEFLTHAYSLTLPFPSPASLPSLIHSLPPFPKRKDQALIPSEPLICLAGGG
jgi:hypothetical protein